MKKDPVDVTPPDPAWVDEGYEWAERVAGALRALALRVDHVGSTAVPGLPAKNVIDIQALVFRLDEPEAIIAAMAEAGFRHAPDNTSDTPHADATPGAGRG